MATTDEKTESDPFLKVISKMPKETYDLLISNVDPSTVNAADLLKSSIPESAGKQRAQIGLERNGGVVTVPCLNKEECGRLRDFMDEMTMRWHGPAARANVAWNTRLDYIDGAPDYQINLYPSDLLRIVGEDGVRRLWNLPLALERGIPVAEGPDPDAHGYRRVGVFARKYTPDTRPFVPFHTDSNTWTGNLAISGDSEHEGGRLLVVSGGRVHAARREAGEATVHDNLVAHAVSSMVSGVRYSLILFFDRD